MFLGGPPLVRMATGEESDDESLGGADMHARQSGLADFLAADEQDALRTGRSIVARLSWRKLGRAPDRDAAAPAHAEDGLLGIVPEDLKVPFDPREVIARIVDGSDFDEFKPLYGSSLITGWARLHGYPVGILANARGVLFSEESQKAAQFIQLANQTETPLLFLQNTTGYMVGSHYERAGIIKHGAMMINAVSNSRVPHLTVVMGASYGAGNYGMCGRAYDPRFLFSWPSAKSAVMGPAQLAGVLSIVGRQAAVARGEVFDEAADAAMRAAVEEQIESESQAVLPLRPGLRRRGDRPAGYSHGARPVPVRHPERPARVGQPRGRGPGRVRLRRVPGLKGGRRAGGARMSTMITRVLVANRGEIARRVFRTCRREGIGCVAVCSDLDSGDPHAAEADALVRLPGSSPADTYLNGPALVAAARAAGADAVHPGYGWLSEDAGFARAVQAAGLTWIGPPADAIEALGSKIIAKKLAAGAGVPVLPELAPDTIETYPVLIKASAGGGGRGMRVVRAEGELRAALESARQEAELGFGDGTVFCEPLLAGGRHVEVQVLADAHGTVWALTERDCSVQRRFQKVIEETPSPAVDARLRGDLLAAAQAITAAGGYLGAGTASSWSPPTARSSSWSSTPGCRSSTRSPSACTASTWSRCSSTWPAARPCRRRRRPRRGTRSRPGCTRRTRPTATARPAACCGRCRSRAWTCGSRHRRATPPPGSGWTRVSRPAARSACSTTRCWPS